MDISLIRSSVYNYLIDRGIKCLDSDNTELDIDLFADSLSLVVYVELVKNAKEKGLAADVKFYLEFFKYGCPPHGGFAIGVDRLTMLLLDLPSLKESMFLFRGPNRLNP